jgi:hypothetical protein
MTKTDNKVFNIETETVVTIKNKKTGHVYKNEEEVKADLNAKTEDIQRDTTIRVTNKGLEMFKKFMNQK